MSIRLEGQKRPHKPKAADKVECRTHGIVTTWGALNEIQRLAVEEGLDTAEDCQCLLSPRRTLRTPTAS
jgi:hypothetical protein